MRQISFFFLLAASLFITSCNNDDDAAPSTANVTIDFKNLEDLGDEYVYEGWIIVDGSPVSTGTFKVDANGQTSQTEFEVDQAMLESATTFVLSIEPSVDPDPAPSAVKLLAGDFNNETATINTGIVGDFSNAAGSFIFATPTTTSTADELSGVWFLDKSSGTPQPTLTLPALGEGFIYEGWAVIDGTPVSTGTFKTASGADDAAPFSGTENNAPPYPGEDFINNAPTGLTFPVDLSERPIVVTIEPVPDNNPTPFSLKPLLGVSPANAVVGTNYELNNQSTTTFPWGTVTR